MNQTFFTLSSGYLFALLSNVLNSDERLLHFYGVKNSHKWEDSRALEKRKNIINNLRILASQQQELLKYTDIEVETINFSSIKNLDIYSDSGLILIYSSSRIEYNQRELLSRKHETIDFDTISKYLNLSKAKVFAITSNIPKCEIQFLETMRGKDFWGNRTMLTIDDVSFFPNFNGITNLKLVNECLKKGNIVISF